MSERNGRTERTDMRARIKEVATEMLIRHGYLGLRFQQIADALSITRGNVHYHFGNKRAIADEVIADYIGETLDVFQKIWMDPELALGEKIHGTMMSNRRRYLRFNPDGKTVNAWSLIARMRLERDTLSVASNKKLDYFLARLEELMTEGVRLAVKNGELRDDAPVQQIAYHIVTICNSSDPITRDAGSFDRLVQLYTGFHDIVEQAFGIEAGKEDPQTRVATRARRQRVAQRAVSREM
jgi:TetR/AcrR family transcriptional regulator, transcriptional repressor for nem operon